MTTDIQITVVLEKGSRIKLAVPEQKLHNLSVFRDYLLSSNIVDKEYFNIGYESKEYLSYVLVWNLV